MIGIGLNVAVSGGVGALVSPRAVYDFANNQYSSAVSYAGGPGLAVDASGTWQSFAQNVLRRTNRGVTIEPAATNLLRNNNGTGAVAGSPGTQPTTWSFAGGTVAAQIVATGTENGLPYVDIRYVGTPNTSMTQFLEASQTQISRTVGQQYSAEGFMKIVAGGMTNITQLRLAIRETNAGSTLATKNDVLTLDGTLKRVGGTTQTASSAGMTSIFPTFAIIGSVGNPIDITVRFAALQVKDGPVSTPIVVSNAQVTRPADQVQMTLPAGSSMATFTFDDGSMQSVSVSPGVYTIPTNLNRAVIARMIVT